MIGVERNWQHILGDGHTSERIVKHLVSLEEEIVSKDFMPPFIDYRKRLAFSVNFFIDNVRGGGWERPRP